VAVSTHNGFTLAISTHKTLCLCLDTASIHWLHTVTVSIKAYSARTTFRATPSWKVPSPWALSRLISLSHCIHMVERGRIKAKQILLLHIPLPLSPELNNTNSTPVKWNYCTLRSSKWSLALYWTGRARVSQGLSVKLH